MSKKDDKKKRNADETEAGAPDRMKTTDYEKELRKLH
jgi:hypothetical protein